ncbi:MAG: 1-acyl-sn-glycerol-3-phosphate acyltransferase [Halanaerobium sp. 4-GBenrich]|uniref:1-acyl-sn-glycerol-3-phosphate acyltransferase n=1 Tax=Halanaerobium congolense TaxID=54121 RepID=A0A1G6HRC3_9FIRM|nr:lysophospholipid acyltransferase family protein [Halanaerobium congolense]KXS47854.1 MAG: 1-acyl-sn-glycerol-3-phosphate acyltransferase [Halanaerobium sp. T82-1]ODS50027.1 MAG: 1-acyl-sn-glycerol-3-phosphate acyltransferase [Halanaerobium sp. 4-GBenrich]PUU92946.1 MAG: 1-acyl-sn-glycerol-3-phosphate acyltransferase [Halanaerobium sp.]PXV69914.1 1-acyl-sn-glycerol-3-phosphate acyltransferase [Halanaerobium congolense]TDP26881.1 1-acyl-sn-glycerol-3-phosphate acyltransferase [Halanaerobium c
MKNFIYQSIRLILLAVFKIFFGIKVRGKENLPAEGGVVLMSNHISAYDPPLLAAIFSRPVRFMAKKELFKNPIMRFVLYLADAFPVDRSKNDITAVKNALSVIRNGEVLGIFPEGTRRPEGKLGTPKSGSVMLAIKSGAPIVPIGIKNIKKDGVITVNIGEPFTMEKFSKRRLSKEERKKASKFIKDKIKKELNYK